MWFFMEHCTHSDNEKSMRLRHGRRLRGTAQTLGMVCNALHSLLSDLGIYKMKMRWIASVVAFLTWL
jgi:hypothetical protein